MVHSTREGQNFQGETCPKTNDKSTKNRSKWKPIFPIPICSYFSTFEMKFCFCFRFRLAKNWFLLPITMKLRSCFYYPIPALRGYTDRSVVTRLSLFFSRGVAINRIPTGGRHFRCWGTETSAKLRWRLWSAQRRDNFGFSNSTHKWFLAK